MSLGNAIAIFAGVLIGTLWARYADSKHSGANNQKAADKRQGEKRHGRGL